MALKVRIKYDTLEFGYKGDDNLHYAEISDHEVGAVIDKSDIPSFNEISIDRIIDVFPPDQQSQIRVQLANTLKYVTTSPTTSL